MASNAKDQLTHELSSLLAEFADNIHEDRIAEILVDRGWRKSGPDISSTIELAQKVRPTARHADVYGHSDYDLGRQLEEILEKLGWRNPNEWCTTTEEVRNLAYGTVVTTRNGNVGELTGDDPSADPTHVLWYKAAPRPRQVSINEMILPVRVLGVSREDW